MNSILQTRKTGFFKAKIVAINPDKEKLEQILEEELEDEPEYVYIKRDGTRSVRFDIFLENVSGENELFKYSIYLEDADETYKSGASRYINQVGESQITNSEDKLFESMKFFQYWDNDLRKFVATTNEKEYRVAKKGEYELMSIYILANQDIDMKGNNFLDINTLLDGDLSALTLPIGIPCLTAFAYVQNDEEAGYKQKIFREFADFKDYDAFVTGKTSKYNARKYQKWHSDFDFVKDQAIYNFGRLDYVKEEHLPATKEFDEEDSEY